MAPNLERSLIDSYYLLTFCTRVRIQMTESERAELESHVANIVVAQQCYAVWLALPKADGATQPIMTTVQATSFWQSYINLSNIAAPATIESIRYFFDVVEPTPVVPSRYHSGQRRPARAPFFSATIVTLLLCLGISLVSYVGTTTLAEFDADYQHWTAMSVAARPDTLLRENKDSQGKLTLTIVDVRGNEVLQVSPRRMDRFRDAFNYLLPAPANAAAKTATTDAAASGSTQLTAAPVVLPASDLAGTAAGMPAPIAGKSPPTPKAGATAEAGPTRPVDNQAIKLPCALGADLVKVPPWTACHDGWLDTTQRTSIITDELVHAFAELQAERDILWTVVVPMNLVLHPRHTARAIWYLNRDVDAAAMVGPARDLLKNPGALRTLIDQMIDHGVPIPTNLPPPASELIAIRQEAVLFLAALQNYVLPVLFGLLGACVQVVRTTSRSIENFTFMKGALSRYWARLVLGMVAGPAINWLIDPHGNLLGFTTTGIAEQPTITSHLGPIALAFVAGYAIEILFSILDKFITVFRDPGPAPAATRDRSAAVV